MDVYEARRLVIEQIIKTRFGGNQSKFAEVANVSPTYVTRMLKAIGEKSKKRIGDDMAVKLEGIPELDLSPGSLLNPVVKGRNESETPSDGPDLIIHKPDGDIIFIELKKAALTESTLTPAEIEDFIHALLDVPPRKARETLAALVVEAEEFRQYARSYIARTRVTANPKHYLPTTDGLSGQSVAPAAPKKERQASSKDRPPAHGDLVTNRKRGAKPSKEVK